MCGADGNTLDSNNVTAKEEVSEARKYLDHLLNNGYTEEQDETTEMHLPPWYDEKLCEQGQAYYHKYRLVVVSGMLHGLIAVLAVPTILQVLICTKQSGNARMAYKRYVETILHVVSWHNYPLKPGSKSWESLAMVRRAHFQSSKKCIGANSGKISQKDLALTQYGFFGYICLGAEKVGIFDKQFKEATVHLWRVIGYMLGIKDEYNLCTDSWATTKPRLDLVVNEVYKPALENPIPKFMEMTTALIDGLWPVNTFLTLGSYLFFTKRLSRCEGYEYFDSDFPNGVRPKTAKSHYYEMSLWDRFIVSYGLFLVTYLYPYTIIRIYLNFRVWLDQQIMYYLPYVAIFKFGHSWAYIRIFSRKATNRYHLE